MKKRVILYHIVGWLLFVGYYLAGAFLDSNAAPLKFMVLLYVSFGICMAAIFYYCYLLVYPLLLKPRKIFWLIIALMLVPILFTALRFAIDGVIYTGLFNFYSRSASFTNFQYVAQNVYHSVFMVVLSAAIWSAQEAFKQQSSKVATHIEQQMAELASLQMTDLKQEVTRLGNYIELHQFRLGDLCVELNTEGQLTDQRIAMLILLPFVEQAFKYGVTNDARRPIKIHLKVRGNLLMYTVSYKINQDHTSIASSAKLDDTQRRLELIYPNRHELLIAHNSFSYKVTLNITL